LLCSAAEDVEVYLASSILDGSSMFLKLMGRCLMGVLRKSLSLFQLGLEKNGQTSVSNFPKLCSMIPAGGGTDLGCLLAFLLPSFC